MSMRWWLGLGPLFFIMYQNCGDQGFKALSAGDFASELSSNGPIALGDNNGAPTTLDELLANTAFTLNDAEQFYTIDQVYEVNGEILLSTYLSSINNLGQEIVTNYRQTYLTEKNQQVVANTTDFPLLANHEYYASVYDGSGNGAILTILDNGNTSYHLTLYARSIQTCTVVVNNISSSTRKILKAGTQTILFTETQLGIFRINMHIYDANCTELNRVQITAQDERDLFFSDAIITDDVLYLSAFTALANSANQLVRQPVMMTLTTMGVLQKAMVYSSPNHDLSAVYLTADGSGTTYLAGVVRQNLFASRNIYHFKIDANLVASAGFTAGHESTETAAGIEVFGNNVYVFGTMEHPQSELEAVFYYRMNTNTLAVDKQIIIDSPTADIFKSSLFLRGKYFALSINVGDDSRLVFLDDTAPGVPTINGFNTFTDNLVFTPLSIQSSPYTPRLQ